MTKPKRKTSVDFFREAKEKETEIVETRASGKKEEPRLEAIKKTDELTKEEPVKEPIQKQEPAEADKQLRKTAGGKREFRDYFEKKSIERFTQAHIDVEQLAKLKTLAHAEKTTIMALLYNIIDEFLTTNDREIKKTLQNYMKMF